jgi:hypothetical protein
MSAIMLQEATSSARPLARKTARKQMGVRRPTAKPCRVEQLSRLSELLLLALDGIGEQQNAAAGLEWQQAELEDRHRAIEEEASFLVARSATGAQFQAMIASSALHSLAEVPESDRPESERRIQRYLNSVIRFLDAIGAQPRTRVREFYAPPWSDPHALFDAIAKK